MSISFVQSALGTIGTPLAFASDNTAGNLLICTTDTGSTYCTDTQNNTWIPCNIGAYCMNCTGGANTVSELFFGSASKFAIYEFSGAAQWDVMDVQSPRIGTFWSVVSVAAHVGSSTTYSGSFVGATNNGIVGSRFTIAHCTNSQNNGTFTCTSSSEISMTLSNSAGVAETAPSNATLTYVQGGVTPTANNELVFAVVAANLPSPAVGAGWTAGQVKTSPTFIDGYLIQATAAPENFSTWTGAAGQGGMIAFRENTAAPLINQFRVVRPPATGNSFTGVFSRNTSVGTPLFAIIAYNLVGLSPTGVEPTSTVTDDQGNTWALGGHLFGANLLGTALWYCLSQAGGVTPTITVSLSGGFSGSLTRGAWSLLIGEGNVTGLVDYDVTAQAYVVPSLQLDSVANSSGGNAVYTVHTGVSTADLFVGDSCFVGVSGAFTNYKNNGVFTIQSFTSTTVTLNNPNAVAETHTATLWYSARLGELALRSDNEFMILAGAGGAPFLGSNLTMIPASLPVNDPNFSLGGVINGSGAVIDSSTAITFNPTASINSSWINVGAALFSPIASGSFGFAALSNKFIKAGDFSLSVSPASQELFPGQVTSFTINVAVINGFSTPVSLSVSGAPSGVNTAISPSDVTPFVIGGGSATMTIVVTGSVTPGTYTLTITGDDGTVQRFATCTLTVDAEGWARRWVSI